MSELEPPVLPPPTLQRIIPHELGALIDFQPVFSNRDESPCCARHAGGVSQHFGEKPPPAENVAVVRSLYSAFKAEGHEAVIRRLLSPRVVWHVAGENPLAGTFRGHTQVFEAMRRYAARSEGTLRLQTQAILGDGVHVVALHTATATRPGVHYSAHEIDVFHVEHGTITEMWSFSEDQAATDAMWS